MKTTLSKILEDRSVKFGTSGLRGLVDDLEPHLVDAAVRAYLTAGLAGHTGQSIFVGRDLRPSSMGIAQVVMEAIETLGFVAVDCGSVPTPALALAAQQQGGAAIMVTGSHIPFDRNGIKFYTTVGEITKDDETAILNCSIVHHDQCKPMSAPERPSAQKQVEAIYTSRVTDHFSGLLQGKRIGLYQHSAVGRDLTADILSALGTNVVTLARSDTFVPIDTEAISDADMRQCALWVSEHKLDALVTTDGDGDRPLLSDENGLYFRGDELGILASRYLGASCVVTPTTSISSVETVGWFAAIARTRVGSPYVLEEMKLRADDVDSTTRNSRVMGFEANGGFLVQSDVDLAGTLLQRLPTRDAILPILAAIALARDEANGSLAKLRDMLPKRSMSSTCLREIPLETSKHFAGRLLEGGEADVFFADMAGPFTVDVSDGMRFTFSNGEVVHVRPSGNAPELRLYVETGSTGRTQEVATSTMVRLEKWLRPSPA